MPQFLNNFGNRSSTLKLCHSQSLIIDEAKIKNQKAGVQTYGKRVRTEKKKNLSFL